MSIADIRSEIKNLLETVPGIGKVHDYQRWTNDWKTFLELFRDSEKKLNGWMISLQRTREKEHSMGVNICSYEFEIMGIYGLKDGSGSEKIFQDLIEAVCSALRSNYNLSGACLKTNSPQLIKVYRRSFGDILAHVCIILVQVDQTIAFE